VYWSDCSLFAVVGSKHPSWYWWVCRCNTWCTARCRQDTGAPCDTSRCGDRHSGFHHSCHDTCYWEQSPSLSILWNWGIELCGLPDTNGDCSEGSGEDCARNGESEMAQGTVACCVRLRSLENNWTMLDLDMKYLHSYSVGIAGEVEHELEDRCWGQCLVVRMETSCGVEHCCSFQQSFCLFPRYISCCGYPE
jgi:hypothetical protein